MADRKKYRISDAGLKTFAAAEFADNALAVADYHFEHPDLFVQQPQ
jgi:hypothetical protein